MKKKDCPCKKCVFWRIGRDGRRAVKQMIAEEAHAEYVASMGKAMMAVQFRLSGPSDSKPPETPVMIGRKEKPTQEAQRTFNFRSFDAERKPDFDEKENIAGLRAYGLVGRK